MKACLRQEHSSQEPEKPGQRKTAIKAWKNRCNNGAEEKHEGIKAWPLTFKKKKSVSARMASDQNEVRKEQNGIGAQ